jgi:hypothetical protein
MPLKDFYDPAPVRTKVQPLPQDILPCGWSGTITPLNSIKLTGPQGQAVGIAFDGACLIAKMFSKGSKNGGGHDAFWALAELAHMNELPAYVDFSGLTVLGGEFAKKLIDWTQDGNKKLVKAPGIGWSVNVDVVRKYGG